MPESLSSSRRPPAEAPTCGGKQMSVLAPCSSSSLTPSTSPAFTARNRTCMGTRHKLGSAPRRSSSLMVCQRFLRLKKRAHLWAPGGQAPALRPGRGYASNETGQGLVGSMCVPQPHNHTPTTPQSAHLQHTHTRRHTTTQATPERTPHTRHTQHTTQPIHSTQPHTAHNPTHKPHQSTHTPVYTAHTHQPHTSHTEHTHHSTHTAHHTLKPHTTHHSHHKDTNTGTHTSEGSLSKRLASSGGSCASGGYLRLRRGWGQVGGDCAAMQG